MIMNPRQLSHELREEVTPDLTKRRWTVGLSIVGVAMDAAFALYQTGIVKKLPDPPLDRFEPRWRLGLCL